MAGIKRGSSVADIFRSEGVRDIQPMKARGYFAKALAIENRAGHCTPEALVLLNLAIDALPSDG